MWTSIKLYVAGAVSLVIGYLTLRLKNEKSARESAELDADTQRANVDLLEKKVEIETDLDEVREVRKERQSKKDIQRTKDLETLKNETDNNKLVDSIGRLLNQNNKRN